MREKRTSVFLGVLIAFTAFISPGRSLASQESVYPYEFGGIEFGIPASYEETYTEEMLWEDTAGEEETIFQNGSKEIRFAVSAADESEEEFSEKALTFAEDAAETIRQYNGNIIDTGTRSIAGHPAAFVEYKDDWNMDWYRQYYLVNGSLNSTILIVFSEQGGDLTEAFENQIASILDNAADDKYRNDLQNNPDWSEELPEKQEKQKPDPDTFGRGTRSVSLGNVTFKMPAVFGDAGTSENGGEMIYYAEGGAHPAFTAFSTVSLDCTPDNFRTEADKIAADTADYWGGTLSWMADDYDTRSLDGRWYYIDDIPVLPGFTDETGQGTLGILYQHAAGYAVTVLLVEADGCQYDYFKPFTELWLSAEPDYSGLTVDRSAVTPEFLDVLDECAGAISDFRDLLSRTRLFNDPADSEEYAELLAPYQQAVAKLSSLEISKMTPADRRYYEQVKVAGDTAAFDEKALKALGLLPDIVEAF